MDQDTFITHGIMFLLMAFLGLREIIPRKLKIGPDTTKFQGNVGLGVFFLLLAFVWAVKIALGAGWISLPGIMK